MWLLEAKSRRLQHFQDERQVEYAILSHTWAEEEVTFADMQSGSDNVTTKKGYEKIQYACDQALGDRLAYVWVDTCQ